MEQADRPTLARVVAEQSTFIRRKLAGLGVPARDMDDVMQEVWMGVHRGLPSFDPSRSATPKTAVRAWLFGICERQAASHRREENRRCEVLSGAPEHLDRPGRVSVDAEARLLEAERHCLLSELLGRLDPDRRAVVVAYALDEVPMAEVAATCGIAVNTGWNRLRLGREDLRAAWRRARATSRQSGPGGS